jgi:soluble cytochrome b562|tara:strand:+ start:214 stop:366 length:153 start_codon:yes stop_codon:yes gene_type:complete
MSHEELNAYEQEIDVLENTVEILIDKLHELVSEGNHAEAQAIAQQINTLG